MHYQRYTQECECECMSVCVCVCMCVSVREYTCMCVRESVYVCVVYECVWPKYDLVLHRLAHQCGSVGV